MAAQKFGPFIFTEKSKISLLELLKKSLQSIESENSNIGNGNQENFIPGQLNYYFRNLNIQGDAKIVFPEELRDKTLNIIVEEKLTFETLASLKTNIHLKIRAATAVGDVNIKSFGCRNGNDGEDLVGRAEDGKDGAKAGANGGPGSNSDGGNGGDGLRGDHGSVGVSGNNGGDGENGEDGRSIFLFVDRFQFGSTVNLLSEGSNGGSGGKGEDGGLGGDGKGGGRGGNGGDGNLLHRAGNAGRGGDGGDGKLGGHGGDSGRNGKGGNGGDVSVIITEPENVPWIGVVKSLGGDGASNNPFAYGKAGRNGTAGNGGKPGNPGRNSVPGRSSGNRNTRGNNGFAPRKDAQDGRVRSGGKQGYDGREDGPRPANSNDLIEFFGSMINGEINV